MAGELGVRVVLARSQVPVLTTEQLVYALLELRPVEGTVAAALPLNLSLVLDRSGSMRGAKIDRLRTATAAVLDLLQPQDTISVVAFNNRVRVPVASQAATAEGKEAVTTQIRKLEADGGTNMAPAMEAGLQELGRRLAGEPPGSPAGNVVSRMVVLTDGLTDKEKRCLEQAQVAGSLQVPVVALGIGRDWNDRLLEAIAERSGGSADYVRDADDIPRHFQRTVRQMQAVALTNARLEVRSALGVYCRTVFRVHPLIGRLAGGAPTDVDRRLEVPLGELAQGHGQTLLLELVVPPRPQGSYRVAQLTVSYDVPASRTSGQLVRQDVLLEYTGNPQLVPAPDPAVMNLVEKVSAFKLQTSALADLDVGNVPAATSKLQNALTRLLSQGDTELAATVQTELDNLEKGRAMTPEGRKTIRFGSGQTVRLDKL